MQQFVFQVIIPADDGFGARHLTRCTAPRADWARMQVASAYAGWTISAAPIAAYSPHRFLGEIDASDMTQADADWLAGKVAAA